jgi:hypothetical protein
MSRTTGSQNLLVNVVRPVYRYDSTATLFTPSITLSNVDTVSANALSVFTAAVGDASSNVYVGSNAGNLYTNIRASAFVTALGFNAGSNISNVSNSVLIGYNAGASAASASNNVIIGDNASGAGSSNVRIGSSVTGTGSRTIVIGAGSGSSAFSDTLVMGTGVTATQNYQFRLGSTFLYGDLSTNWLGLGVASPTDINTRLDVSGNVRLQGQVGVQMTPERSLDVNGSFRVNDGLGGFMDVSGGLTLSTNGFGSLRGTLSNAAGDSTTPIGTLKKGAIVISAQNVTGIADYASSMIYCFDPTDGASGTSLLSSAVQAGGVFVSVSTSNIEVSNATSTRTIAWSITYFPLP